MKRPWIMVGALVLLPLLAWLGYLGAGEAVAGYVQQHWGARLVQAADGKFTDAASFVRHRLRDAAVLLTLASGVAAGVWGGGWLIGRRLPVLWRWVPYAILGFCGWNLWLKAASACVLFWCCFWNGKGTTHNLTQFHIKWLLLEENTAPRQAVLGGSSQTRSQIDDGLLNAQLGDRLWTTELHFPGNRAYDFLFLERRLDRRPVDFVVCYLSEQSFYHAGMSEGFPLFFQWRDLRDYIRFGGRWGWAPQALSFGLLGDLLPVFWLRDPVAQRLLGEPLVGLRQRQRVTALDTDLSHRATEFVADFHLGEQSRFQQAAFEEFVVRCQRKNRRILACCGQLNPLLGNALDPQMRSSLKAFLQDLAARYDHFVLLDESRLPPQTLADYEDLTHVGPAARTRFTTRLAQVLQELSR